MSWAKIHSPVARHLRATYRITNALYSERMLPGTQTCLPSGPLQNIILYSEKNYMVDKKIKLPLFCGFDKHD